MRLLTLPRGHTASFAQAGGKIKISSAACHRAVIFALYSTPCLPHSTIGLGERNTSLPPHRCGLFLLRPVFSPDSVHAVRCGRSPIKMSGVTVEITGLPLLGEHTDEVLAELGNSAAQIAEIHSAEAV